MNVNQLWQTFLETGSPEIYILYNQAKKMRDSNVFDDTGTGASGNTLQ